MSYDIILTPKYQNDIRFYISKKKFKHILDDVDCIVEELRKGNFIGSPIDDIKLDTGNKTYKVRAANSDTKVGKSNGYRIIYYAIDEDFEVYLLTIYYKKDDGRVLNKKEISEIIKQYCPL